MVIKPLESYPAIQVKFRPSSPSNPMLGWWNGRHWRLKISWEQSRAGSIPVPSIFCKKMRRKASQQFGLRQAIEVKKPATEPAVEADSCSEH